ncbi:HotDog domain-containing protein [Auriculariales sp. MPI-PUGE-AT-0066]|nr:HotDog domain-containing protein [Auriculariales sp. MPI-PUGE-AT-0066]
MLRLFLCRPTTWRTGFRVARPQPLHTTAIRYNSIAVTETPRGAEQETREIIALDRLLRIVRARSNPDVRTIMPIRTPGLYAEHLSHVIDGAGVSHSQSQVSQASADTAPPSARAMHDSYSEVMLPLRSNAILFEQFINANGGIRTGKLMEQLDALAGSIAYKHILGSDVHSLGSIEDRGLYVVTAAVDRIDMLKPVSTSQSVADLRLSGNVIYTGRSSMEIAVKMEALYSDDSEPLTLMIGRFSMVCRDAATHSSRAVGALELSTDDERQLFAYGEGHQKRKKAQSLTSLDRVPPSSEEASVLHSFFLANGKAVRKLEPTDATERVTMKSTRLQNCFMMFPQERNVHGKVFGGHLMRLAYELGFTNSSLFARGPVRFLSLDEISFKRPVNIGSIVRPPWTDWDAMFGRCFDVC